MKRKVFKSLVFSMLIILCLAIPAAAFDGGGFYESEVEELEDEALDILNRENKHSEWYETIKAVYEKIKDEDGFEITKMFYKIMY